MKIKKYLIFSLFTMMISFSANLCGGIIENCVFSNKGYSGYIKIYGWVVTEDQVAEAFIQQKDPTPFPGRDLDFQNIYFLIRLENLKGLRAWGTLFIDCPDIGDMTIDIRNVAPLNNRPEYYAIPLGKMCFAKAEGDNIPRLKFKWKKLYTK